LAALTAHNRHARNRTNIPNLTAELVIGLTSLTHFAGQPIKYFE
jgi:hypothetical protein